jgi:hypothetical protein
MRDDHRVRQLRRDLRKLLPHDKEDVEAIARLKSVGYPSIEPILFDMLKWIRQPDWPVCKPMAALLVQIGPPLVPYIQQAFRTHDAAWAAQVIREVLEHWPGEAFSVLYAHIEQQAIHAHYGADLEALSLLIRKRLITLEYARDILRSKRRFHEMQLSDVASIEALLAGPAV